MKALSALLSSTVIALAPSIACAITTARHEFVVWNVGQGLWTTLVSPDGCRHFDVGGERAPWRLVMRACASLPNRESFSHWDWDHVSFAKPSGLKLRGACLGFSPAGPPPHGREAIFRNVAACPVREDRSVADLSVHATASRIRIGNREPRKASGANEWSRVFLVHADRGAARGEYVLVPGDSTAREEKLWAPRLRGKRVWLLVLGHHGSRTSTSKILLEQLRGLRMAVASAREEKYGHPHSEVVHRLKERGIALLKTEDWGSLRFELESRPVPGPVATR